MWTTCDRGWDMGDKADMHDAVWPTLAAHAVGGLSPRLAARAERHLPACAPCRERLEGYTATVAQLTIVGEGSSPELVGGWEWARERMLRQARPGGELRASGDR